MIKGTVYTIAPKSDSENIPNAHALYWVKSIHQFLQIVSEEEAPNAPVEDLVLDKEEVVETTEQQPVEDNGELVVQVKGSKRKTK